MGDKSGIQWTNATWNPTTGCSIVSDGCKNCYAMHFAGTRLVGKPSYEGTVRQTSRGPKWTGKVNLLTGRLDQPLRWKKPRLIFVNSMSDLFHPEIPFDFVAAVFAVMALTPHHTYQVLTKRPERALAFFEWFHSVDRLLPPGMIPTRCSRGVWLGYLKRGVHIDEKRWDRLDQQTTPVAAPWPLPNVWLGTSVEDQAAADKRIPILLQCPAAVRWISAEPLLGPVDLIRHLGDLWRCDECGFDWQECMHSSPARRYTAVTERYCGMCAGDGGKDVRIGTWPGLGWVVVGGESGRGARPCDPAWIRSVVEQCVTAKVPVFVKQLGKQWAKAAAAKHSKGGDPDEWPEDLRVLQWPREGV